MAKRRYEQKNEEKNNAIRQRASEFKEKEKVRGNSNGSITMFLPLNRNMLQQATMDMFQQLAKQRFG
jgi:hypothetical protein